MKMCRGFTLLELMVTIAVLAILATVGVPSFQTLVQNNRVVTQTNELVSVLNVARTEAVKRGRPVEVEISSEANGWSATVRLPGGADAIRVVERPDSGIALVTGDPVVVTFTATGVPEAAVTFNLSPKSGCKGQQVRQIALGPSGQITTTKQACP